MKKRFLQTVAILSCLIGTLGYAQTKIVGGVESAPGSWPSTVALLAKSTVDNIEAGLFVYPGTNNVVPASEANYQAQVCGGTLIDTQWVLTAAHCVVNNGNVVAADSLYVLAGTFDLSSGGTRLGVKAISVHASYNPSTADSDIALLELENSLVNVSITDVLATDPSVGAVATAVGWGDMTASNLTTSFPTKLNEVNLPVTSRVDCASVYQSDLTDNMFCAGDLSGGKDSCQGDSGGPLFVQDGGVYKQAGIVSWGYGCAQAGVYGIYTRLSRYTAWIDAAKLGNAAVYTSPTTSTSSSGGGTFWFGLPLLITMLLSRKLIIRNNKRN